MLECALGCAGRGSDRKEQEDWLPRLPRRPSGIDNEWIGSGGAICAVPVPVRATRESRYLTGPDSPAAATAITQSFGSTTEVHQGAVYWVIGTESFDRSGVFSLTSQGYVSPAHEDLEFPAMAAEGYFEDGGNGGAIMTFTLSGNGGPTGADNGGFYPSTAYGRVSSTSKGLSGSEIHIADLGQSPQDGFTEYDGLPGPTGPRWGDYSWAIYLPWSGGKIIFATNYIQYPNCVGSAFTLTVATCGGTGMGSQTGEPPLTTWFPDVWMWVDHPPR
jgi:hypothetical protein